VIGHTKIVDRRWYGRSNSKSNQSRLTMAEHHSLTVNLFMNLFPPEKSSHHLCENKLFTMNYWTFHSTLLSVNFSYFHKLALSYTLSITCWNAELQLLRDSLWSLERACRYIIGIHWTNSYPFVMERLNTLRKFRFSSYFSKQEEGLFPIF